MMRRLIPCGLVCLMLGCAGPKVGDVVTVRSFLVVYLDPGAFGTAAELAEAGSQLTGLDTTREADKATVLDRGSRVRIVGRVRGGSKVVIEEGKGLGSFDAGKMGWVLDQDLERETR